MASPSLDRKRLACPELESRKRVRREYHLQLPNRSTDVHFQAQFKASLAMLLGPEYPTQHLSGVNYRITHPPDNLEGIDLFCSCSVIWTALARQVVAHSKLTLQRTLVECRIDTMAIILPNTTTATFTLIYSQ